MSQEQEEPIDINTLDINALRNVDVENTRTVGIMKTVRGVGLAVSVAGAAVATAGLAGALWTIPAVLAVSSVVAWSAWGASFVGGLTSAFMDFAINDEVQEENRKVEAMREHHKNRVLTEKTEALIDTLTADQDSLADGLPTDYLKVLPHLTDAQIDRLPDWMRAETYRIQAHVAELALGENERKTMPINESQLDFTPSGHKNLSAIFRMHRDGIHRQLGHQEALEAAEEDADNRESSATVRGFSAGAVVGDRSGGNAGAVVAGLLIVAGAVAMYGPVIAALWGALKPDDREDILKSEDLRPNPDLPGLSDVEINHVATLPRLTPRGLALG